MHWRKSIRIAIKKALKRFRGNAMQGAEPLLGLAVLAVAYKVELYAQANFPWLCLLSPFAAIAIVRAF